MARPDTAQLRPYVAPSLTEISEADWARLLSDPRVTILPHPDRVRREKDLPG